MRIFSYNKKYIGHLLIWLTLFFAVRNNSHSQTLAFENYTVDNGLSAPQILSVYQSHDDMIWLGTANGGVFKFDGRNFLNLSEKNGLLSNYVFSIYQDDKKRMFFGTLKGINFSKDGRKLSVISDKDSLSSAGVLKIFKDSKKRTWVGLAKGIALLKDTAIVKYSEVNPLDGITVLNIEEDPLGRIWFSTLRGAFYFDGKKFNKLDGINGIQYHKVNSVHYRGDGKYWILGRKALYEWDEKAGIQPGDSIYRVKKVNLIANDTIPKEYYAYVVDKSGIMWIGTQNGLYRISKNGSASLFTENQGLVKSDIYKILQDREGNLWFCSKSNGVSKLSTERYLYYNHKGISNDIETILRDYQKNLLVGSSRGVFKFNREAQRFDSLSGINFFEVSPISSLLQTKNSDLYVANFNWVFKLPSNPKEKGKELMFNPENKRAYYARQRSMRMIETHTGEILAATNAGIFKLVRDSFRLVPQIETLLGPIAKEFMNDIFEDEQNNLWIAHTKGVSVISYPDFKVVTPLKIVEAIRSPVKHLIKTSSGEMFFATDKGIYRWDGSNIILYSSENCNLISNQVTSIAMDKNGTLWAGLSNGFARLDFDKQNKRKATVKCYDIETGFLGQGCNSRAILIEEESGHIYFGTSRGVLVFQPEFDLFNQSPPYLKFNDIKLFADSTDWTKITKKVDDNNIPTEAVLSFSQNYLTFSFVGVSNYFPLKIRYQYYLKGFDENWCFPTTKNEIYYSNLPPGDYEFMVKASNADGVWVKDPISFKFTIKPPFYNTWYFYGFCILIVASGIYSYIKINLSNRKITSQNEQISRQKELIEKKNNEVLDSINYAKTIQEAILPPDRSFIESFAGAFVLYRPKDIVSGDFYWMEKHGEKMIFAVVDCTGHGVPGAFMSIVGHNALNQAVREKGITTASLILDYLNNYVNETLHNTSSHHQGRKVRDGMDMSLCVYDTETQVLEFAGAYNPLVLIRNGEMHEYKADRRPIGSTDLYGDKPFKNNIIQLQKRDRIYLFSDGYADQFGGPDGKKFYKGKFKDTLLVMEGEPMHVQKQILIETFMKWKGDFEQVDDICIIGVQI